MTTEEELKELILSKYRSLREFVNTKLDMSYSTFDSILKRGVKNANIINVLKICEALGISVEALARDKIVCSPSLHEDGCNKDIIDILANTKKQLLSDSGLTLDGKPAEKESIKSILDAMEIGIEIAKRHNKN